MDPGGGKGGPWPPCLVKIGQKRWPPNAAAYISCFLAPPSPTFLDPLLEDTEHTLRHLSGIEHFLYAKAITNQCSKSENLKADGCNRQENLVTPSRCRY